MTFKILKVFAVAASVLAVSSASEAGGKRHGSGYNKHGYGYHVRPYDYGHGGYGYYQPENCHYYFRKARYTGSHHWWKKYRRCISRY
ncbi:MAG: hypothetical protein ACR2O3_05155 [Rhizobiaceae bacterium]